MKRTKMVPFLAHPVYKLTCFLVTSHDSSIGEYEGLHASLAQPMRLRPIQGGMQTWAAQ